MSLGSPLNLYELSLVKRLSPPKQLLRLKAKTLCQPKTFPGSSLRQDVWDGHVSYQIYKPILPISYKFHLFRCQSSTLPSSEHVFPLLRNVTLAFTRSCNSYLGSPLYIQIIPAIGIIAFALWFLGPLMRYLRSHFRNDTNWKKSRAYHISTSYVQPLLLWSGTIILCRFAELLVKKASLFFSHFNQKLYPCSILDRVVLPLEASQAVKIRFLNFVKSLSTVLTVAYCLSSLIQQSQKFFMETTGADDTRKMGFEFAGRAIYTAVWVASVSLFMELLGFSTQKWITAGGLGTVLLTLAGREIFTNFLSSVMIHATRPFVVNEWIQTKIEGYEVSGTVEHVGWWSPTIIRGDDREAVHIPNHKFTVNVVRNLSQKSHWRIKTHLAISHLDVNKISNIVADMRKVLAKNPQIEQQRLHRRVFLDNMDPENQALLILISCFVKTSHFEEYLCVKEAVLLDLLRVISHHRARLATPIRTVQKIYGDSEIENIPFAESVFRRSAAVNRPFLLIDSESRINGDDKAKLRATPRVNEDQSSKTNTPSEPKYNSTAESATSDDFDKNQEKVAYPEDVSPKSNKDFTASLHSNFPSSSQMESLDSLHTASKAGNQKPTMMESTHEQIDVKSESGVQAVKQVARPAYEDNIVLGVALEGSKRTLPIEEGIGPSSTQLEANEFAAERNASMSATSSKESKGSTPMVDQKDQDS
ncbi:mechanosensitive ion channel protein 2, chloroplastic-like isoform X1 [Zingiber officinale]|uniref:mechanosensitive ion channel protein 2, chloroplastic-like isoform X1 n=1 Tax=Zingiber officinale TaxID=94328 RepID=UPI001C4CFB3C|nr:mechanosensitive ion channel protein 2, chloroplastic-like isoform X1 [Zingiber officinale]XP_042376290.1 mechanosensitive ion channel protein 2, chloroplastic-like isoform X1 [Zingiber officinale]